MYSPSFRVSQRLIQKNKNNHNTIKKIIQIKIFKNI